jgi:hypothetical protein
MTLNNVLRGDVLQIIFGCSTRHLYPMKVFYWVTDPENF